jgi:transcription elongation factor Elf1
MNYNSRIGGGKLLGKKKIGTTQDEIGNNLPISVDPVEHVCPSCGGEQLITGIDDGSEQLHLACSACPQTEYVGIHDIPSGIDAWAKVMIELL